MATVGVRGLSPAAVDGRRQRYGKTVIGKKTARLQREAEQLRDKVRANKVLLDHARREELTDGALRRALRDAVEIERRVRAEGWALEWDPDWEQLMYDPEWGSLAHDLAWELLIRTLDKRRPTLEEAERSWRKIAEEFGIDTLRRDAEELNQQLRNSWPEIEDEYERVETECHQYGYRHELEEEYLLMLEQRGATSPRAVRDLEREMSDRFPPPPFGNGPPESLEQLRELMHTRAEELGLGPGDVRALDEWVRNIGPSIIAAWASRPPT